MLISHWVRLLLGMRRNYLLLGSPWLFRNEGTSVPSLRFPGAGSWLEQLLFLNPSVWFMMGTGTFLWGNGQNLRILRWVLPRLLQKFSLHIPVEIRKNWMRENGWGEREFPKQIKETRRGTKGESTVLVKHRLFHPPSIHFEDLRFTLNKQVICRDP